MYESTVWCVIMKNIAMYNGWYVSINVRTYQYLQPPLFHVRASLLWFHFYPLWYAAVLLKFTCYAQYYAQEQGLIVIRLYAIYIQFCINNSLHIACIFHKDCFIRVYKLSGIKYIIMLYCMMTVLLEYIDHSLQFSTNA